MNQANLLWQAEVAGTALGVLVVALLLRQWILSRLRTSAKKDPHGIAAALAHDLRIPSVLWCIALAAYVLTEVTQLSKATNARTLRVIVTALILSFTIATASAVVRLIQRFGESHQVPFAFAGLSRTLARGTVYAIGLLVFLRYVGIDVFPVVTALGFGGLALALALQDTIGNFFAGLHILTERPIGVGDFVRVNDKDEGTVTDIGWRTTRILTGTGSTLVIPNKFITQAQVLNYSNPTSRVKVSVPVVLHLEADAERAGLIAVECALSVDGVSPEPPPSFVADPGMLPTHLQYKLVFQIPAQTQSGRIRTQVINRMLERFRRESVPLPDPTRFLMRE